MDRERIEYLEGQVEAIILTVGTLLDSAVTLRTALQDVDTDIDRFTEQSESFKAGAKNTYEVLMPTVQMR